MRLFEQDVDVDLPKLIDSRMLLCANSGGGKSWAVRKLLEEVGNQVMSIVLDVEGEFKTMRESYDFLLVGQKGDLQVNMKAAPLLPRKLLELSLSTIIDISDLKMHDRIQYMKKFLEALMELPRELWKPCLVIVDESHLFCGQQEKQESCHAVIDLMTRGRKRGFAGVLCTQRIAKLHKDAVAETNNYMVGRTGLDLDMRRASEILGLASKQDMLALRDLEPGEFYCLGRDTKILMADGSRKLITSIVRNRDVGPVLSMENGRLVQKRITDWHTTERGDRYWVRLIRKNDHRRVLWATNDHLILTPKGWTKAGQLKDGDLVITEEASPSREQMQLLVGGLLGDSSLNKGRSQSGQLSRAYLRLLHCKEQREWLDTKVRALQDLDLTVTEKCPDEQTLAYSAVSSTFETLYRSWYPNGRRQLSRKDVKEALSPRMIASWYLDDGSLHRSTARIATHKFSEADVRWLADLLTAYGIETHANHDSALYKGTVRHYFMLRVQQKSAEAFFRMIAPFVPPSMRYKLPEKYTLPDYDESLWSLSANRLADEIVVSRERHSDEATTYCLSVEDTQMFFASGLAVHNCFGPAISRSVQKVKVGRVKTTHPKSGMGLSARVIPPRDKVKAVLSQLSNLPQEAEEQAKTMDDLRKQVRELEKQLRVRPAPQIDDRQIEAAEKRGQAQAHKELEPQLRRLKDGSKRLEQISKLANVENSPDVKIIIPDTARLPAPIQRVVRQTPREPTGDVSLGKCERAILSLLYNNPDRQFKKTNVGLFTGYSHKSGGFNNAVCKLNAAGLIQRVADSLMISPEGISSGAEVLGDDVNLHEEFTIENWAQKLPKCESVIFQCLMQSPHDAFTKEELGEATSYQPNSGGFNNAICRLNSLGLIVRQSGRVQLNPEVLEK